jgi:DNA gyrase subunit A
MATNIPPFNLGEIIDACFALIEDPEIDFERLTEIVPGPDFPTGGLIIGHAGARAGMYKGRGSVLMRGRTEIEETAKGGAAIIITEIPYQVNKASMIEKIADLVREKRIEGISDIRDESDRQGMRVVIELRRDAVPDVILNQLYRYSQLQTSFGINMLALNQGKPELMSIKEMLQAFISFREEVVTRRTKFELGKARDRAHVLVGLAIAVANIDEVIAMIRTAPDPATARARLLGKDWPAADVVPLLELIADQRHAVKEDGTIRMTEEQARAILDLRLQRLTALGRDEIGDELKGLGGKIAEYLEVLRSRIKLLEIIREELAEVRAEFATDRKTQIVEAGEDLEDEDLIQRRDMVVTVTHKGYIKRVPLDTYRTQRRGGKGRAGMSTRDEDFVTRVFVANTHTPVLFFSSTGMVYKMKVWRLPEGTPQARGRAMMNLLPLAQGEIITNVLGLPDDESSWESLNVMFATKSGSVRRNQLTDFVNVMANGKIAMKLDDPDDGIIGVAICTPDDDVLLTSRNGKTIRFPVGDVRVFKGRASMGVRGIKLLGDDHVVSMSILHHVDVTTAEAQAYLKQAAAIRRAAGDDDSEEPGEVEELAEAVLSQDRYASLGAEEQFILTLTENGFGKRSSAYDYRTSGRGGQGIAAMDMTEKKGRLLSSFPVEDHDQIMLVTDKGKLIRVPVGGISVRRRSTQGVTVFDTADDELVVSVERIEEREDEDSAEDEGASE